MEHAHYREDDLIDLAAIAETLWAELDARQDFFSNRIFAEPAWHVLLTLFVDFVLRRRTTVEDVTGCGAAAKGTTYRSIRRLEASGRRAVSHRRKPIWRRLLE